MLSYLEKNKIIPLIITIILAVEIFLVSNITGVAGTGKGFNFSTIYHFGIFFMFTFFLLISIKGKNKLDKKYLLVVILISIFYAITDEFHQLFVPGRFSSLTDILVDSIGSLSSLILFFFIDKKTKHA
jgi:VanZ like family